MISVNNFSCTQWSLGRIGKAGKPLPLLLHAMALWPHLRLYAALNAAGRMCWKCWASVRPLQPVGDAAYLMRCPAASLPISSAADMQLQLVEAAARLARDAANEAGAFSGGRQVLVAGAWPRLMQMAAGHATKCKGHAWRVDRACLGATNRAVCCR